MTITYLPKILIGLVALLHIWFLILEMFLWTKPLGLKTFRQTQEKADLTKVLAQNQGLYNGFLAAGLIWSLIHTNPDFAMQMQLFVLDCVVIAGVFGALTFSKKILYVQALPAVAALMAVLFVGPA